MGPIAESLDNSTGTRRLFFVLSGEHESLPAAEVGAILDSVGLPFSTVKTSYRLLLLEGAEQVLKVISERSLMYDWCGIALGECEANEQRIHNLVRNLPLESLTKNAGSFAVRSARLGGVSKSLGRVDLERSVGSVVSEQVPRLKVRLSNPDITFACIFYDNSCLVGISSFYKRSGLIAPRRPRKRPVFHPSTMPPKIARCMVNLSRAKPGGTFLDPFSGVGGISIEAAVIGCDVVGMDASFRMLRGARRNLRYFGLDASGFLHGDARNAPFHDLEAVATDPPYGRGSSTMGAKATNLVSGFLDRAGECLKRGAHVCISSPVETQVEEYGVAAGFKVKEKHLAKVHRSLTRQFVVLQNT